MLIDFKICKIQIQIIYLSKKKYFTKISQLKSINIPLGLKYHIDYEVVDALDDVFLLLLGLIGLTTKLISAVFPAFL